MYAPEVILHSTLKALILRIVTGKSEPWTTFASRTRLMKPNRLPRELAGSKSIGRLHLIVQRRVLLFGFKLILISSCANFFYEGTCQYPQFRNFLLEER